MQEMVIYGVSFDMVGKQPIVLLKTVTGNKFLPIWIGHAEAAAILMKLQGAETPRPMTHDLLSDVVSELNAEIAKITVTELRENTFYALITLRAAASEIEIDSRPSDALALAVRSNAPIFAADRVIEIIRGSKDPVEAKDRLVAEPFKQLGNLAKLIDAEDEQISGALKANVVHLTPTQAQAILDLRLQRLTALESDRLRDEARALRDTMVPP